MKVQFICAAGKHNNNDIGIGHLKRCLKLAAKFNQKTHTSDFLIFGDDKRIASLISDSAINRSEFLDFDSFFNSQRLESLRFSKSDCTFVDISNSLFLSHDLSFSKLLKSLKKKTKSLILIDGLGEESYLNNSKNDIQYDFLLAPYFGAENYFKKEKNHLLGPDFFISDENLINVKKKIKDIACNICITCGGSDPQNITYKILRSISEMDSLKIKIKVIIGPNFYEEHTEKIRRLISDKLDKVEIINSPESIKNYIEWSDITIATSGLTKYEILSMGTPSIIIPFDKKQFLLNKESSETGAFITIKSDKISSNLGKELCSMIEDKERRNNMSKKASILIDGKGADRIINHLGF